MPCSLHISPCYSQNLRLAADDVGGFAFFAGRGFGPGFLEADVDGGVDDAAVRDFGARETTVTRIRCFPHPEKLRQGLPCCAIGS